VTVDEVVEATGCALHVPDDVTTTREPTDDEHALIERFDPTGQRFSEVADADA
jgi:hypothetical protein